MKSKSNSLKNKLWLYLIIFSTIILVFLWSFQVISLNKFYEYSKTREVYRIVNKIENISKDNNFYNKLDALATNTDACIQVYTDNEYVYTSSFSNRACNEDKNRNIIKYKQDFVLSGENKKSYKIIDELNERQTLLYGIKLNNDIFAFVNLSLKPLDSTRGILKEQLIFVTLIILTLSTLIAYYFSKKISKPIEQINKSAKELAKSNFNVEFDTNTDINELNELSTTLNYTKEELSKTDTIRRELMANVSHDLKTPLTMIKAYAEMVRDLSYKDEEKRNSNLNTIIEETDRLNLLVNDILDLTKLENNTKLNIEKFDINELIKNILKRYDIYTSQGYSFILKESKNSIISADKKRLEQVMYNLINNAINYTGDDKKIYINIINKKDIIRVEVKDTGKGIDQEEINLIWDKYYKCDKTHSRLYLGTGIGLSIVKSILINHNFNYGVDSIKNKGTTFYFEINKSIKD